MVWQPEVDELQRRHAMADAMGGPEGVARQRTRGKLMVRERLDMLVDPGSFQQMGKLAGHAQYDADGALTAFTPGSRLRGVAKVNGRRVWLQATDFSVRGASGNDDDGGVDIGHGHPDALELRLPAVFLIDTAGGSVNEYNELGRTYIPDGPEYSESVSNQLSLAPVVSVVLGPAAGGAAPLPPLAHFSVMAKGTGQVFPGGPPVVKAALGIEIDKEDLGGWRIHTRVSGVVDNAAESEADAIEQAKRFLSYLPDNVWQMPPRGDTSDDPNRRDERLLSLVPRDIRKVYDPYVMIAGVFDAGSFFEIAPAYGRSRVIGLARTHGYPIGVITSNPRYKGGSMDTAAAEKSTRLVQLCDTFHIPVVILLDEPGFQVGVDSEKQGVERAGARLMHAMLQSKMPWVSIILRRTFGLAGGIQYRAGPHLYRRYAWVSGRWGSMHIEGGTDAAFRRVIAEAPDPDAKRAEIEDGLRKLTSPFRTAEASGLDLIDPRDTRSLLCDFVDMAQGVIKTQLGPGVGPTYRP